MLPVELTRRRDEIRSRGCVASSCRTMYCRDSCGDGISHQRLFYDGYHLLRVIMTRTLNTMFILFYAPKYFFPIDGGLRSQT